MRTIQDIDSEFTQAHTVLLVFIDFLTFPSDFQINFCMQEALKNDYISGSTAIVVLWMNGQILVGNLGDSKALVCSRKTHFDQENEGSKASDYCLLKLC